MAWMQCSESESVVKRDQRAMCVEGTLLASIFPLAENSIDGRCHIRMPLNLGLISFSCSTSFFAACVSTYKEAK